MSDIITANPATGEKLAKYSRISLSEIKLELDKSKTAYNSWKQTTFEQRKSLMNKLADFMEERLETYARLATQEMGKPIVQARQEIEKCAKICRYYANNTSQLLKEEIVDTEATKSYVTFQPIGPILAIMPWNFPFYQVIRFAAPAIMAGNTGVLKHASNVQGCAFALDNAFKEVGFPQGVFTNLNITTNHVKDIIEDKNIVAVTLTGSDLAGRSVASIAGQNLKKTVLELGGSDAYIILEDADMEYATDLAVLGRLQNCGQTCVAAKRFIVISDVYEKFLTQFKAKMKNAIMGDPMKENTYYGPMARVDLRDEIHQQVLKTVSQGGKLILGGEIPEGKGAYYPATILADLEPGMEAFDNELFGPVASVVCAKDELQAVELANNSQFGLGSGVITANRARGERLALQLEAGSSFVNKLVISDPRMPFGGIKNSGYGRELSDYGIREFVNVKSVWIN